MPKGKSWGVMSEYTKKLRERQMQNPMVDRCGLCNVTARTAKGRTGIDWFKKHEQTPKHQRNLRKRQEAIDAQLPQTEA